METEAIVSVYKVCMTCVVMTGVVTCCRCDACRRLRSGRPLSSGLVSLQNKFHFNINSFCQNF